MADVLVAFFVKLLNGCFKYTVFVTQSKKGCCVSQGSLHRLFNCQWPMMPDPSHSLSPLALYCVFSHLCGNHCCMLLLWCLSTAKVSLMCLMDLPVRFSVRFRVPQARLNGWALPLFVPVCQWVEAGWGWDRADNGCFVLLLDVLKRCSCGPGDAWSNRDTQRLCKRLAVAHSPQSAMLPTCSTFWSRAELQPSQPFTHIKALFHTVGTLTFSFCSVQRIF